MDQAVYEKQSAISGKFIAIADEIAERLGLKMRLHKLDIENVTSPECEIGLYTPTDIRIGTIEVRLSVADNKASVTLALFRDLETTVDDWTFDTASKPPSARRRMRCMNPKCSTDEWDGSGFDVEMCPSCGQASSTVDHCDRHFPQKDDGSPKPPSTRRQMRCTNPNCGLDEWLGSVSNLQLCPCCRHQGTFVDKARSSHDSRNETPRVSQMCPKHGAFNPPTCPECDSHAEWLREERRGSIRMAVRCSKHGAYITPTCPECKTALRKERRMRCTNTACKTGEWTGGGHQPELCPTCRQHGERVTKQPKPTTQSYRMLCTNSACGFTEWETGAHQNELCPMCHLLGKRVDTMSFLELGDVKEGKRK